MAVVGIVFVLWGWSMAFGTRDGRRQRDGKLIANPFTDVRRSTDVDARHLHLRAASS